MKNLKLKSVKKKAKPNKKILLEADKLNKGIIEKSKELQEEVKHLPDVHAICRVHLKALQLLKLQESLEILKKYFLMTLP